LEIGNRQLAIRVVGQLGITRGEVLTYRPTRCRVVVHALFLEFLRKVNSLS